jgi:hypothetical protein
MTIHIYIDFPYEPVRHGEFFSCIQNAGHHRAEKRSKEGGLQAALPCISKEKARGFMQYRTYT